MSTSGSGHRRPQVDESHRTVLRLAQRHADLDITLSDGEGWGERMGSPKSWRAAETVEDSGFHSAMTPSHAGMVEMATKGFPRNPMGNSRVRTAVTASGLG